MQIMHSTDAIGPDASMSADEMARLVRLSKRNLYAAYAAGKISADAKNGDRWGVVETVGSYIESLRATAAGRAAGEGGEAAEALTALRIEQARNQKITADLKAIELASLRGELLPTADLLIVWQRIIGAARSSLLGLANRLPTQIHGLTKADVRVIDDAVRTVLEKLAGNGDSATAIVSGSTAARAQKAATITIKQGD